MKQFLLLICVLSADTFFVDPSLAALDVPKEIPKSGIKLNGVAPTFNAYFAFHIQDPKITKRLATLHEAALNVTADFAPFLVAPDMLQLPLVAFHLDDDDIGRIEYFLDDVVLKRSLREYLPRRVTFFDYGKLYKSYFFSNQMVAMLELIDPWLSNVKDAIRFALNRHGFVCSTAEYYKNYITVIDDTSEKQLNIARINIEDLQMLASAQVCKLYVCRENGDDANRTTFCNVVHVFTTLCY